MDDHIVPQQLRLLRVHCPDRLSCPEVLESQLPADWRENQAVTQKIGTLWLQNTQSALLKIPSVVVPFASNILFNPAHAESRNVNITSELSFDVDPRLKRLADYALSFREEVRFVARDE